MSQEIRETVAKNVKLLRVKKALKREELSLMLGFENSYISKLERKSMNITIDKLAKLAAVLDVEPYVLLKRDYPS